MYDYGRYAILRCYPRGKNNPFHCLGILLGAYRLFGFIQYAGGYLYGTFIVRVQFLTLYCCLPITLFVRVGDSIETIRILDT